MKKKHNKKHKHAPRRNAAPAAASSAPRVSRPRASASAKAGGETALQRLGYTAAGAAGTALIGSFLAREGWAPKTIAGALTAVGAGLAWRGDASTIRSVGAGAMSAAGSQLALMVIDDRDHGKPAAPAAPKDKPRELDELPPGAVESAFERARERLSISGIE